MNSKDIIVIMGGGINTFGHVLPHVAERCDYVVNYLNNNPEVDTLLLATSSFSLNIPPKLTKEGYVMSEATAIRNYLISKNVSNEVLCEQLSHDTFGSILFCFLFYIFPIEADSVTFVTSDFHKNRVKLMIEIIVSKVFSSKIQFTVVGVKTKILDNNLHRRIQYELQHMKNIKDTYSGIKNKNDFFKLFFASHTNYNCLFSGRDVPNQLY
jgi:uncharacterized SAM-binding protein YcdF (DUF218 family)